MSRGWKRCIFLPLILCASVGCAPAARTPSAADPCEGAELDLDALPDTCAVPMRAKGPPPSPAQLAATIDPVVIRSGATADATVRFTNATGGPLTFDVTEGCTAFEATIETPQGQPVSFLNDCMLGGLCGATRIVRVTLPPRGVLRARSRVEAVVHHLVAHGDDCEERREGGVAAGKYALSIELPFADPDANGTLIGRTAHGEITVSR
jgi:hypothetical protein